MKTDIYTKIVLTVIAICLTISLLKEFDIITTAKADTTATAPAPIPTATQNVPVDVNITHIDGLKINLYKDERSEFPYSRGLPISSVKELYW